MDVDSSFAEENNPATSSPLASSATITNFNNLFYENASPGSTCFESPTIRLPKKRRSFSPLTTGISDREAVSSSPGLPSSPSDRKLGRIVSGPVLFGGSKSSLSGFSPQAVNALKRPRRPALSALVHPSQANAIISSAYPILSSDDHSNEDESERQLPPARRAFSAMIPPSALVDFSDESFDGLDGSSPAQAYAQRQQVKTIRRCDGTDDFRPLTGATAMVMQESPSAKFMCSGMPGFGDNELMGKILPCHRVSEDGLMRITVDTVSISVLIICTQANFPLSSMIYWMASMTPRYKTSASSIVVLTMNTRVAMSQVLSMLTRRMPLKNNCSDRL